MSPLAIVRINRHDHFLYGLETLVALKGGEAGEVTLGASLPVGAENSQFHTASISLFLGSCFLLGRRCVLFRRGVACRTDNTLSLDSRPNNNVVSVGSGNGALDENQVPVC